MISKWLIFLLITASPHKIRIKGLDTIFMIDVGFYFSK